jgi:uncharacterized protein
MKWHRWSFIRQVKLTLLRFLRLQGTPDEIAKGFALGVFIAMTPTIGFQMIIAVFIAFLLRENKIAAALGVWVSNPITAPFIYAFQYETGRIILGMERARLPREFTLEAISNLGWEVLLPLCLGSLIFGFLCAALSYALVLRFIPFFKRCRVPRWPRPRKQAKG